MCVKIKCDVTLPSVNHLYPVNRMGRKFLSVAGKKAKEIIRAEYLKNKFLFPEWIYDESVRLEVMIEISLKWLNRDGSIKKRDVGNYEKFLTDTIFDLIGIDDSRIFKLEIRKGFFDNDGFEYWINVKG